MVFWVITIALTAAILALLVLAMWRRGAVEGSAESDVQVYRDQLREVERDLARGVITEAEAGQIRIEVSRRLLEADRAAGAAADRVPPRLANVAGVLFMAVVAGGAVALYGRFGAPGYPDLPLSRRIEMAEIARATRPGQAAAEEQAAESRPQAPEQSPEFAALMERLRTVVAERPDDVQGLALLAQYEARTGNYRAAWEAQAALVAARGDAATADEIARQADLMILAAGGFVSPEAEAVLDRVLALDPANGTARYYAGLMAAQTGRPDVAFRVWRVLLEGSPPDAPWVPPIRAQIGELAFYAGVEYDLPPAQTGPGPTGADIAASEEMTPADRMAMVEGMVARLSDRLASEGGPPEDWARLVRSLGVLGRREEAARIWAEAQDVFPDAATRLPILEAARDAGVAE